jgi:hypothetical protein
MMAVQDAGYLFDRVRGRELSVVAMQNYQRRVGLRGSDRYRHKRPSSLRIAEANGEPKCDR